MPKPLPVDWHEVETLAKAVGVREAARQMDLSEAAVRQRSSRYKWFAKANSAKAALAVATVTKAQLIAVAHGVPVTDVTEQPSAADILAKLGPDSRSKLAIGLNRKATHLSEQPPQQIDSTDLLQLTKAGSTLHGWQEQAPGSAVMVNVNLLGLALEERSVVELPDAAPQVPGPDAPG